MSWLKELIQSGGQHYTCTSNVDLEATPNSRKEAINYDALLPLIEAKLGRPPKNHTELIIVSEQILRETKR